ncbi:MAG: IS1595 family transposase, partial [Candidatus Poribacteria bacterium]|nr:IS1595 family transposase [Candidatus Poribacteria bacterium]
KVSLRKWFITIYLMSTSKKGISSIQLAKQVGVTQKTAWFMDHRIREAMKQNRGQLFGGVEVDEKYVGGKEKNKHASKRLHAGRGRGAKGKVPVVGVLQRGGEARAKVVPNVKMRTVEQTIMENVKLGSDLFTDEFASYAKIDEFFNHESVNHSKGEYVKGEAHTNTAESFWALFQRGYVGIYHHMSKKHLQRYMDEFVYRWGVKSSDFDEIFSDLVLKVSESGRIKYKALTR